jgi:hypothetical protein
MNDRRAAARMLCSELVQVHFRDERGRARRLLGNLEDISLSGLCIQVDDPVPLNTALRIRHPKGEFSGSVRYCLFREIGYFLGVQFEEGCRWSPEQFTPHHMLDLRTLVVRRAAAGPRSRGGEPKQ